MANTRDGEFAWFYGGNHRLHLAKLLELDNIPVQVVVRDESWQELRAKAAKADSIVELSSDVREHSNHPDLEPLLPESSA